MIAIVGAGISGLVLAHDLAARGMEYVVLERDSRVGGVIRSATVDGHLLEWGPQRTRLVPAVRKLIYDVGLENDVITAPADLPLVVYRNNKLSTVPMSLRTLFASDLLSLDGKLRILLEPFTHGEQPDESVETYFIRKLGREAYASLLGPLYGGLYASDPADMLVDLSLTYALRDLRVGRSLLMKALQRKGGSLPAAVSFTDGMQMLPDALYREHQSNIMLDSAVTSIERSEGPGARYTVTHGGARVGADHIVFTGSAPATARLIGRIVPETAGHLSTLRYNPLAIVHLHTTDRVKRALGYQVSFDEDLYTRGVTFNDALFARRGVYTSYLGGARNPDVVKWEDERIANIAIEEFAIVTGADASAISVDRAAMPAWDRSWRALSRIRIPDGMHFCSNWESRPGLPGRIGRARALAESLAKQRTV